MKLYSKTTFEHFLNPRNAHPMPDADASGTIGDPACGDSVTMFIKVQDNTIEDISYLVFGCGASIATSSMLSVIAKGKSLEEALLITEEEIVESLDGLPEYKIHCSNLGVSALHKAIRNYFGRKGANADRIVVVGMDPPCSRCQLLSNVVAGKILEYGLEITAKHLPYTSEEAKDYAIRNGLVPGTAKDVSRLSGIEIDDNAVASLLAIDAPDAGNEFYQYNDCGWMPELDEMLRPLEKAAKEFGIMMTPVLVMDGEIKHQGSVPALSQIEKWMQEMKDKDDLKK